MGMFFFERIAGAGRRILALGLLICVSVGLRAQIPIVSIITGIAKKVVVAIDLEVQSLQTETIGLQNAEKKLENAMDLDELTDITGWVQKQKDLYAGYYQELWEVKNAISAYERIKQMISEEAQIASQFKQMNTALSQDKHFTAAEILSMQSILTGILNQSVNNINQIYLVINAFVTQMADADRLRIIDEAGGRIDKNFTDMQQFYSRNSLLSQERAQDANDMAATKALYGIQ
jgi:hypothetical protein